MSPTLMLAQNEFLNQSNTISGGSLSLPSKPNTPKPMAPSIFAPNANVLPSSKIPEKNTLQFTNNNGFANPGDPLKEKLNKNKTEFNPNFVNKNMFFGEIKTKSEYVRICYRDYEIADGDVVRIYTDDMILKNAAILNIDCQFMQLRLLKGSNTIYFKALNNGEGAPNTGELQIFDENDILLTSNQWGLEPNFTASITLFKE